MDIAHVKCERKKYCINRLCDQCDLCYGQGTVGEHIKATENAINALKKIDLIKEAFCCYDNCETCQGFMEFSTSELIKTIRRIVDEEI